MAGEGRLSEVRVKRRNLGRGRTVAFFLCRVICCPTNMSRHLRHGSLGGRTCGT